MRKYLCSRLLQAGLLALGLSFVSFGLLGLMPGDPVDQMLAANPHLTAADRERLLSIHGLDQPLLVRYGRWLRAATQGDFGYSRTYHVPVSRLLAPRLVNTFVLALASLAVSLALALPLGVLAAKRQGSRLDYALNLLAFGGISVPPFFLGILLILVFAVQFGWLPAGGTQSVGAELGAGAGLLDRVRYLVLPTLTLAALQTAVFLRYTRGALVDVLGQDYVRTARAKGLSPARVLWRHGFRNALVPLSTVLALQLSTLFSGAVITETVFAYQGMGKLAYDAIMANDYNVAMVAFLLTILMVLFMNLVADLLYAWLDPRIRLAEASP